MIKIHEGETSEQLKNVCYQSRACFINSCHSLSPISQGKHCLTHDIWTNWGAWFLFNIAVMSIKMLVILTIWRQVNPHSILKDISCFTKLLTDPEKKKKKSFVTTHDFLFFFSPKLRNMHLKIVLRKSLWSKSEQAIFQALQVWVMEMWPNKSSFNKEACD